MVSVTSVNAAGESSIGYWGVTSGGNSTLDEINMFESMLLPFQGFFKRDLVVDGHNDEFPEVDQTASVFLTLYLSQLVLYCI